MDIDYTVAALMFPAIPLMMTMYSNRFHTLSGLIRKLHDQIIFDKRTPPEWEKQLHVINNRTNLLQKMNMCVGDDVDVGGDVRTVKVEVVAGIHDGGDARGRHRGRQSIQEARGADASGERNDGGNGHGSLFGCS